MTPAELDSIPIPAENGELLQAKVTSIGQDWTLAWCHDGGRRVEPFGPVFVSIRQACRAAARLNARGMPS